MLFKTKDKVSGKVLHSSKPLLLTAKAAYSRPGPGKAWFQTTTTVWRVDEMIRRSVRDWKRLLDENGHTGSRAESFRADHDSVYTATYSVFPAPLMEWILVRYGGPIGGKVLDAFAGGPVRAVVSAIMGMHYHGVEIRQEQIDENLAVVSKLGLEDNVSYYCSDARFLDEMKAGKLAEHYEGPFDVAITCPPYYDLEQYSDQDDDLSNAGNYAEFNAGMFLSALGHYDHLKPGAFVCIIVGPFRDKKSGELIDFPAHTVENFREAGFVYWQEVILSKNFASAAKRSTMAWRGMKLVPSHEFLLIFRKPGWK